MQIKRFRARDMTTALRMVKDELGPEAVILSTREMKDRGELGPMVEVTAGVGYNRPTAPVQAMKAYGREPETKKETKPEPKNEEKPAPRIEPALKGLEGGLAEIKELLLDLTYRSTLSDRYRSRTSLVRLYRRLLDSEVDPSIARALIERTADANGDGHSLNGVIHDKLAGMFRIHSPFGPGPGKKTKYLALIGPSGVGKTTTLAKLAALGSVKLKKRMALISLDTIRLGAAEQIRTYARIMGLPVRVVLDRDEFLQAVELFDDVDMVLIDTPGRILSSPEERRDLEKALGLIDRASAMLVISAATKDRDIADVIKRCDRLPTESLVISKIDETGRFGNVINNLIKYKIPVSYLTNGQKVPDDLIPATPERLADLITAGAEPSPDNC